MGINLSESEWCRKATPEVPCRTQGFSQGAPLSLAAGATRAPSRLTSPPSSAAGATLTCAL